MKVKMCDMWKKIILRDLLDEAGAEGDESMVVTMGGKGSGKSMFGIQVLEKEADLEEVKGRYPTLEMYIRRLDTLIDFLEDKCNEAGHKPEELQGLKMMNRELKRSRRNVMHYITMCIGEKDGRE